MAEQFGVVEQAFNVRGRGVVIYVGSWSSGHIKRGDWIEIRSTAGSSKVVRVKFLELGRLVPGQPRVVDANNRGGLLLSNVEPGDVSVGDTVWTASQPPEK